MARVRPFQNSRLELDDELSEALWDGQRLDLAPESYMVLQLLARAPDKIHSADEIMEAASIPLEVDGYAYVRQIKLIQRAFTELISSRGYIEVVRRQGYKWSEPHHQF